ncbi:MAG: alpha/beta hydrolase [Leptospira sp.]|nr:alpha/beta hydrolase [Leptospira sp.]
MKKIIALLIIVFLPQLHCKRTIVQASFLFERSLAGLSEKSIQVDTHEIHYLEGGKGDTILLVHGFAADKDNWTRFSRFLTPNYHVIALDVPGFGESSKINSEKYDTESQIKRINRFTEIMGLKTFHIVGNSMGGRIAGMFTAKFPEKVRSLALFNSAGVTSPVKSEVRKAIDRGENPLIAKTTDDFDRILKLAFVVPPKIPDSLKSYFVERAIESAGFNAKMYYDSRHELDSLDKVLPEIKQPTLILWGDTDRIIDVSAVSVFEKKLVNRKTVIMKDCGHGPMIERPEETANHYKNFLQGIK